MSVSFESLGLAPKLCRAVQRKGYESPTPVQAEAIPVVLRGIDVIAGAQTGTGKTAAFALPILQRLMRTDGWRKTQKRKPRALILTPTRELAAQVHEAFTEYGRGTGLGCTPIFGGVGMSPQVDALRRGTDILVATPGRLIDHLGQKTTHLRHLEILTLDEADRMMDMGFLPAIKKILSHVPEQKQTLLFSATLPPEIRRLADRLMDDPVSVQVSPENAVADRVVHRVHPVDQPDKRKLLEKILGEDRERQTLVFCRTKYGSDRLAKMLSRAGFAAVAIHGNKGQGARMRALDQFKKGEARVLVATDIAARGLDIQQLPMVVNFDLPMVAEDYIHRIGRTGRAGMTGQAVSLVSERERGQLQDINKLLGERVEMERVPGFGWGEAAERAPVSTARAERPARGAREERGEGRERRGRRGAERSSGRRREDSRDRDRGREEPRREQERPDDGGLPARRKSKVGRGRRPAAGKDSGSRDRRSDDSVSEHRGTRRGPPRGPRRKKSSGGGGRRRSATAGRRGS